MDNVAQHVIRKVGGPEIAADLAGVTTTSVYRWTYPREKGGTGGLIPAKHHRDMLRNAMERGIALTADDLVIGGDADPTE